MKLEVNQADLARVFGVVGSVVGHEGAVMVVLGNVLVEAPEGGPITVRGTDMLTTATAVLPGTVLAPGRITLPSVLGAKVAERLPKGEQVTLEAERFGVLTVRCQEARYELQTLPADDFPEVAQESPGVWMTMEQKLLRDLLEGVLFAAATDDYRKMLLCVHLVLDGTDLMAEATDGKKMSRMVRPVSEVEVTGEGRKPRGGYETLLAGDAARFFLGWLGKSGSVRLGISVDDGGMPRALVAEAQGMRVVSVVQAGKYPDCTAVIPKDAPIRIEMRREDLAREVDRALVTVDPGEKKVRNYSLILVFSRSRCVVRSSKADTGRFQGAFNVEQVGAACEQLELAFNGRFLLELLARIGGSVVRLLVKNGTAPVLFEEEKPEEGRRLLLMPIRLDRVATPVETNEEVERAEAGVS